MQLEVSGYAIDTLKQALQESDNLWQQRIEEAKRGERPNLSIEGAKMMQETILRESSGSDQMAANGHHDPLRRLQASSHCRPSVEHSTRSRPNPHYTPIKPMTARNSMLNALLSLAVAIEFVFRTRLPLRHLVPQWWRSTDPEGSCLCDRVCHLDHRDRHHGSQGALS